MNRSVDINCLVHGLEEGRDHGEEAEATSDDDGGLASDEQVAVGDTGVSVVFWSETVAGPLSTQRALGAGFEEGDSGVVSLREWSNGCWDEATESQCEENDRCVIGHFFGRVVFLCFCRFFFFFFVFFR